MPHVRPHFPLVPASSRIDGNDVDQRTAMNGLRWLLRCDKLIASTRARDYHMEGVHRREPGTASLIECSSDVLHIATHPDRDPCEIGLIEFDLGLEPEKPGFREHLQAYIIAAHELPHRVRDDSQCTLVQPPLAPGRRD